MALGSIAFLPKIPCLIPAMPAVGQDTANLNLGFLNLHGMTVSKSCAYVKWCRRLLMTYCLIPVSRLILAISSLDPLSLIGCRRNPIPLFQTDPVQPVQVLPALPRQFEIRPAPTVRSIRVRRRHRVPVGGKKPHEAVVFVRIIFGNWT